MIKLGFFNIEASSCTVPLSVIIQKQFFSKLENSKKSTGGISLINLLYLIFSFFNLSLDLGCIGQIKGIFFIETKLFKTSIIDFNLKGLSTFSDDAC